MLMKLKENVYYTTIGRLVYPVAAKSVKGTAFFFWQRVFRISIRAGEREARSLTAQVENAQIPLDVVYEARDGSVFVDVIVIVGASQREPEELTVCISRRARKLV